MPNDDGIRPIDYVMLAGRTDTRRYRSILDEAADRSRALLAEIIGEGRAPEIVHATAPDDRETGEWGRQRERLIRHLSYSSGPQALRAAVDRPPITPERAREMLDDFEARYPGTIAGIRQRAAQAEAEPQGMPLGRLDHVRGTGRPLTYAEIEAFAVDMGMPTAPPLDIATEPPEVDDLQRKRALDLRFDPVTFEAIYPQTRYERKDPLE
jgi:hypothetical protein